MPIRPLDEWAVGRTQSLPLASLKDSVIGIDASHYINQHLLNQSTREALLGALGGFPFALRANIEKELQVLKNLGVSCIFVFNGLEFGKKEQRARSQSSRSFEQAWDLYDQQQADQVVDAFSSAGTPPPETLFRFLQRILVQNGVQFMVAPYSAAAQLYYLASGTNPVIDSVYAPSEALLFDIDKLITRIDTEPAQFFWITKQTCKEELGRLSDEQFLEFCLLLGSPFLRSFPLFENPAFPGKNPTIRDALPMFNAAGRSALTLCAQFDEDRRMQELQYTDLYKRAYMVVKHHVFIDVEGRVGPLDAENAPSDVHELIGQRLPEELYFYLSKGILGADVPNYLTSGQVRVTLPLGTEDTEIYRQLVGDTLTPTRTQSMSLLANSLHRFYQTKVIEIRPWFDENSERSITLKGIPSVKETIQSWRLHGDKLPEGVKNIKTPRGSFKFAVQSLSDSDFVAKSFATKDTPALSSQDDILSNVMWRFMQLRGYIDDKHKLTSWGQCLSQALSAIDPADNLEEAIFLAIEMLRLNLLNTKPWFSHVSGGPMRGSEEDKTFNMLISRVACIAKLQHKSIGYSGPLSRQLLCYRSLISEVRSALRNLVEVVLASMLLSGDIDRDRDDWTQVAIKLPFIDDNDCGLGIAVRTYLDDLPLQANSTSPEARADVKAKGKDWFQHSESFTGNLDLAFKLWDAVYAGTQNAGREFKESKLWEDANKYNMARLSYLLFGALTALSGFANAGSAVKDLIPSNFDDVVLKSGKPALVEFFAPWCGHCKTLAPVYEELAQTFAFAEDKVTIAKVDADENRSLGKRFGVQGFPTVKWFDGKSDKPEEYKGGRDIDSLSAFITEKTGVKPRSAQKEASNVEFLNDVSFKTTVGTDKDVLVAFTAPWCGHCKSLAPTWESLANDFARESNVVIAKVDAEAENARALTKEQGVTGYPTIKFFPKGSTEPETYSGARSEEAFIKFINQKAGTHRAPGGGLDATAGTIAVLDKIVSEHVAAQKLDKLVVEVKKAAEGLEDKYAEYYVKAADKLSKNEGYAAKEVARLQKILAKGGSAPEKLDDIVSRSNILSRFVGDVKHDEL
ncbi:unnamed protein product [Penicillium olsonii]|nr:unnamed protein product [Penicillium olsonii]